LPRSSDSSAEAPPLKERIKSSEHVSSATKKAEKKIDGDGRKFGRVPQETVPSKESFGSQLEREITERKAERETLGKKTSKVTLDKLFQTKPTEREGKSGDKEGKPVEKEGNSVIQKQFGNTPLEMEKESKKDVISKDGDKKLTVRQEVHPKEKQKSVDVHVKASAFDEPSSKRTNKDRDATENDDVKKRIKDPGIQMEKDVTSNASRHNSLITSSTDKDVKDTVIRKVVTGMEEKEYALKKDEIKKPSSESESHRLSDEDDLAKDMRRGSLESCEEDDKTKKKLKPMPKCKKKALGILSDADGSQDAQGDVSEEKAEDIHPVDGVIKPAATDPEEIYVVSGEVSVQPSTKEMVAPVLTPELVLQESKTAANTSFTLMPHLERACTLELGSEFHVPEKETLEAKKITSRSSSLNVPPYPQRSIFSPQQPSKDPPVSELFDFENDILAVDETVNDDGFSIARDSEEIMRAPPLTFSFSSEFLFKEDSKEDSARETHLLVEKLRLEYAKKTTTNVIQPETAETLAPVPDDGTIRLDEVSDEKREGEPQVMDVVEANACESKDEKPHETGTEVKVDIPASMDCSVDNKLHVPHESQPADEQLDKSDVPSYMGGDANGPYDYHACSMQLEVSKVSIPGREKLDRSNSAQADERWVPPSMDFVSQQSDQHHSLMPPHHYETLPPAPSPYTDLRNRAKWTESEMIPARRSSSSSASSTSSSSHREEPDPTKRDDLHLPPHTPSGADLTSYQGLHPALPPYLPDAPP
jgi:hypothetical protein